MLRSAKREEVMYEARPQPVKNRFEVKYGPPEVGKGEGVVLLPYRIERKAQYFSAGMDSEQSERLPMYDG